LPLTPPTALPDDTALQEPLPTPENKVFYPALDGLRAVAVLMVFTVHFLRIPDFINWGALGVDVFFVLSGFLITGILFDSRNKAHRFRIFYIRRTLRIFPLYYGVLLVPALLYPVFRWQLHPGLWLWPVYLGNYTRFFWPAEFTVHSTVYEGLYATRFAPFSFNYDHLWSLCVEEQFYLVWPLVVFLVRDRVRLRNLCLAVVALIPVARLLCLHFCPAWMIDLDLLHRAMPLRADDLLLGGALALGLRGPERTRLLGLGRWTTVVLVALFVFLQGQNYLFPGVLFHPASGGGRSFYLAFFHVYSVGLDAVGSVLVAVGTVFLIVRLLNPGSLVTRAFMLPWLRALGQRSYGFYVYHVLLYKTWEYLSLWLAFGHRGVAGYALPVVALVGTVGVSWLSFHYFEAPILRLKDRFAAA
jgi:peptidoglycan/LPS O-acetylase OafA/YrhL